MVDIPSLPAIDTGDINDAVILVIHDPAEAGDKGKRGTRGQLLTGYFASGDNAAFGTLELGGELTGQGSTFTTVEFAAHLKFTTGATMTGMRRASEVVATGVITSGGFVDVTMTVPGAAAGDHVLLSFDAALGDGVHARGHVSAADTVSIRFDNTGAGSFPDTSYTCSAICLRFA